MGDPPRNASCSMGAKGRFVLAAGMGKFRTGPKNFHSWRKPQVLLQPPRGALWTLTDWHSLGTTLLGHNLKKHKLIKLKKHLFM